MQNDIFRLPLPVAPRVAYWPDVVSDAFSIAIVSFAITVSIGKLFAKKHGYKISANQVISVSVLRYYHWSVSLLIEKRWFDSSSDQDFTLQVILIAVFHGISRFV